MIKIISHIFFSSNYLKYRIIISNIFFILGIILIFAFPLLSENTFINENQLKNTPLHQRDIDKDFFIKSYQEYLNNANTINEILKFCQNVLNNNSNPYNFIYSKEIISPRGDKLRFIQINLIYEPNLKNKEKIHKANVIIYTILKFYSDPNNIPWLSRDIQFNYITKELFYDHPLECFDLISSGKYNNKVASGKKISGIINIDLTEFDIENFYKLSLRFHGINSEQIDMDYYKMIYDNFISTYLNIYKFVTHDNILSKNAKKNIKLFCKIPSYFFRKYLVEKLYCKYIIYAINNILSNFFMINNHINTNHILVTKNKNSILLKVIPKYNENEEKNIVTNINNNNLNNYKNNIIINSLPNQDLLIRYRIIVGVFELIIKGISRDEIDLFRGQYFYILLNPKIFVGYYYLLILLLLIIRIIYEIIDYIYNYQFHNIRGGKITGGILFISIISIISLLNIKYIINYLKFDNIKTYYLIIGFIIIIQFITLAMLNLNRDEEKFINEILMFILVLNCWNFIFINIGIGLFISIIILPMENIFLHLKKAKYIIIKLLALFIIIYSTLTTKILLSSMIDNYLTYNNNVYIIINCTLFFLILRMNLFIIMIINYLN